MIALIKDNFFVADEATKIEFGIYDEPFEKWALFDENGAVMYYVIDDGYAVVDYNEADKPEDYVPGKYMYIDGEFVPNPDWIEPEPSIEEKVSLNTSDIEELMLSQADILMELSMLEMGIL